MINTTITTDRFCGIISLWVIPSLVVNQHLDQLVVHDLHVHLGSINDDDDDAHNGCIWRNISLSTVLMNMMMKTIIMLMMMTHTKQVDRMIFTMMMMTRMNLIDDDDDDDDDNNYDRF